MIIYSAEEKTANSDPIYRGASIYIEEDVCHNNGSAGLQIDNRWRKPKVGDNEECEVQLWIGSKTPKTDFVDLELWISSLWMECRIVWEIL
ncbi:hypothetical protein L6452_04356 [Arctium lappa]|uniref:Uncharacterized protein n=1 Tax=Arctium lappa TaxID=4217 RepID=A0ACB9FP62_ARCLA|nr:hypothetical protein L6452_04356 [Arctium lappa]